MYRLKNNRLFVLALTLSVLATVFAASSTAADIYRWQDEQGYWHFSDSPPSSAPIQTPPAPELDGRKAPASSAAAPSGPKVPGPPVQRSRDVSATPDMAPQSGGMFWRVDRPGTRPSYLLGTIHSSDPRVVRLKPAVVRALDQADRFVMEMIMDTSALTAFGATMLLTGERDLESLLGSDLFKQVVDAMAAYGLPEMAIRRFKPWVVMAMLSMPKPSGEPILDLVLYQRAVRSGKPTAGLESAQEQLAVFEGLAMNEQIELLKTTLQQLPALPDMMEGLLQAYLNDDLSRLTAIAARQQNHGDPEIMGSFMRRLNDDRNRRMVRRMQRYLDQGNSFIAVGALHLAGPAGLVASLRQKGYAVDPVPLP